MNEYKNLSKIKDLIKKNPKDNILKLEYAKLLALTNVKGNLEKAEFRLLKLKPIFPTTVLYELAKIAKVKGEFEKAKKYLLEIVNSSTLFYAVNYYELATVLSYLKEYDEAKENLLYILQFDNNNIEAIFKLISIYITEENYEEVLNLINSIDINTLDGKFIKEYNAVIILLSKKFNIYFKNFNYNIDSYGCNQMKNYSFDDALFHIKKHTDSIYEDEYYSNFNLHINIKDLMLSIKDKLTDETFITNNIYDLYIIKYNDIGCDGENLLKVITLPNTKDIITMFPCKNYFKYSLKNDKKMKESREIIRKKK